jgi:hypothetical protein
MAYGYNPNFSGGRDQEDCGSKPARVNSSWNLILTITLHIYTHTHTHTHTRTHTHTHTHTQNTKQGQWSGSR